MMPEDKINRQESKSLAYYETYSQLLRTYILLRHRWMDKLTG